MNLKPQSRFIDIHCSEMRWPREPQLVKIGAIPNPKHFLCHHRLNSQKFGTVRDALYLDFSTLYHFVSMVLGCVVPRGICGRFQGLASCDVSEAGGHPPHRLDRSEPGAGEGRGILSHIAFSWPHGHRPFLIELLELMKPPPHWIRWLNCLWIVRWYQLYLYCSPLKQTRVWCNNVSDDWHVNFVNEDPPVIFTVIFP